MVQLKFGADVADTFSHFEGPKYILEGAEIKNSSLNQNV